MNKCKGCQWYGKPYWSIINPCDNCPREVINEEIYMELPKEKITFYGNTEEEKKANELLFDMGLELSALDDELKEKDKEIDRLNNIINELTDLILLKKARAENEKDYSKYYIEGFTNALKMTHSTPDGIMLETIKSTTIAICKEFLDKLKELKEANK